MIKNNYKYQEGEVVNTTLRVVSQTQYGNKKLRGYEVQSLVYPEAPTYIVAENNLSTGSGCAYKTGHRVFEGNSIYSVSSIRPYIVYSEEAKTIAKNSSKKKVTVRCLECHKEKLMLPSKLMKRGFFCDLCSKGISYPELFIMAYLEVHEVEYEYQRVFDTLPNRRFDFYLPEDNMVIETHGIQHYSEVKMWDKEETIKSDRIKEQYCKDNNISYLALDSSTSTFAYMETSVNKSILPSINKDDTDLILEKIALNKKYPVKEILSLYHKGKGNSHIGRELGISSRTIHNILKRHNIITSHKRRVRCRTTGEEFESISDAKRKYHAPNIARACKSKKSFSGKHPETGRKLKWEFID